jgi:phosphoribosylformylglycinamidine (FGAM) synthase PurS component
MSHNIFIFSDLGGMTRKESNLAEVFSKQTGKAISRVKIITGYFVDAEVSKSDAETMAKSLFMDPVVEASSIDVLPWKDFSFAISTGYKPGVTDNVGHSASIAVKDLGIKIKKASDDFIHAFNAFIIWSKDGSVIEDGSYTPRL